MIIAIVDDNQVNLTVMSLLVKQLGEYEVHTFVSSQSGLDWALTNEVDLILVDFMMPQPDGLDFIKQFRAGKNKSLVPVIMITASNESDVKVSALDAGANDFLNKPINKVEFQARIRNLLALRKSQKQLSNRAGWLAGEVKVAIKQTRDSVEELITRLATAAESRDRETGAHIKRIAHFSRMIARNMRLSEDDQEIIFLSSPMHDIGKIAVPDAILHKPGKLTDEEFEVIKLHPIKGYEILANSDKKLIQKGAEIALSHHERFDGTGYPYKTKGENIPVFGRIVAVADVFDALVNKRAYKQAWTLDETTEYVKSVAGSHLDPLCVEAFISGIGEVETIILKSKKVPEKQ